MMSHRAGSPIATALRDERGSALIVSLLVLTVVGILATGMAQSAVSEIELASNLRGASRAFYAADGGAEKAFHDLVQIVRANGRFPTSAELGTITAPTLTATSYPGFGVNANGGLIVEPLPTGFYQGLMAQTQPFRALVTASTTDWPPSSATVEMDALMDIIPLFQFAVFYEHDMEIFPGPPMDINGRVHTNADMYLGSGSSLRFTSTLTAANDIYNFRKDNPSSAGGSVKIRDAAGIYQSMAGLDSTDPNWRDEALERWDGTVRSREQEARRLNLAIEEAANPHVLIEPGRPGDTASEMASKLYYQADLRILNGVATDGNGNAVSLIDPMTATSALEYALLEDPRENKVMVLLEIDVEKLGRAAGYPANGVIYAGGFEAVGGMPAWGATPWAPHDPPWDTSDTTEFAVKLINAAELPSPMTVITENPVYVQGHYNTVNKKPAAVMGDAITVLSRDWGDDDWDYSQKSMSQRTAKSTTINAAFMLGGTTTTVGNYNGGLENVIRLLEKWSGKTFTYRGSLVNLWNAQVATGAWSYGNPIYQAPHRDWAYDTDLLDINNQPPASPSIYTLRITGWNRQ